MSWRDSLFKESFSLSYEALSNSFQLKGPLIAFRHIDGEHKSACPFCARLFHLPYIVYMQLKAFDGFP